MIDDYAKSRPQSSPNRNKGAYFAVSLLVLPVHAVILLTAASGLWLVVTGPSWVNRAIGLVLLLISFALRPRFYKHPGEVTVLRPDEAPGLFTLLVDIAAVRGARPPDEVTVSTQFNASVGQLSIRRHYLDIGAPLWVAGTRAGRVALLGHELGHLAHRDLIHGLWVGTAYSTLVKWERALRPSQSSAFSPLETIAQLLADFGCFVIGLYMRLIELVNAAARRRMEYLADLDAVRCGGTDGALELMDTLLAIRSVEIAVTRAAVMKNRPDVWDTLRQAMQSTPELERERRRRAAALDKVRSDDSHPSTFRRISLIRNTPFEAGAIQPTNEAWFLIERELTDALARAGEAVTEQARFSQ